MKQLKIVHRLAAVVTASVLMSESAVALATNFGDVSKNIVKSSAGLPNLISTVAYVGGVGLGVAGVFKLKNHVDNPANIPMKDGLVRLGAGGGLLVLPYLTKAMMGTVQGEGGGGGVQASDLQFKAVAFE